MAKSKYESHVGPKLGNIISWTAQGATAKEVAQKLGVSYSAFRKYLERGQQGDMRYSALAAAFEAACQGPDDEVETGLFKRAKGYFWEEEIYERRDKATSGQGELLLVKRVKRHQPADPTSAMFWLTNRRSDKWSYKPKEEGGATESGVALLPPIKEESEST